MSEDSLGTKIGDAVRDVATDQATAYAKYAALLERFAKKEIDVLSFGRSALDIYADAVRDLTQVGGRIANDSVKIGITKVKSIKLLKTAQDAVSSITNSIVMSPVADAPAITPDAAVAVAKPAVSRRKPA
jgi:hypothetical protein